MKITLNRLRRIAIAAIVIQGLPALAASPKSITTEDLRVCMGFAGSPPDVQVKVCSKVINSGKVKHPHQAEYYAYRSGAYLALQQTDMAKDDLDRAIKLQDKHEYRFQRAGVLLAQQKPAEAGADLTVVLKSKPDFAPAHFLMGVVHFRHAEFEKAVGHFDKASDLLPTYYQALFARGVAKLRSHDEDGGRKDIETARGMSSRVDEIMKKIGIEP